MGSIPIRFRQGTNHSRSEEWSSDGQARKEIQRTERSPQTLPRHPGHASRNSRRPGQAAQASFRAVAILPAILLIVFGAIWLYDRASYGKGGFKAEKI